MVAIKVRIALVGLGFGAEFVPIYLNHPDVASLTIMDTDSQVLHRVGDTFGVEKRLHSFDQVIEASEIDAVHLVTPIPLHAQQTLAVLQAGKHCACTVPMATTLDDLRSIVEAQRQTGKNYMMMETAVYTREFLFVQSMYEQGQMGPLSFLRGAHYQDMENWPSYWEGLPPMHYATHAISPLLALTGARAIKVHCFGSGRLAPERMRQYGNPYPVETAIFQLDGLSVAAEVTRSLFQTARAYTESFSVLAEKTSFEWQQIEEESPVLFKMESRQPGRGRPITVERLSVPDRADRLPESIARFTQRGIYDDSHPHLSFLQGGGHGGSHPHLVHEFVRSIVEERQPWINAITSADWTAPGICAHESALRHGVGIPIPSFGA